MRDDVGRCELSRAGRYNMLTVAQHAHAVAKFSDLLEAMADVDNADTRLSELANSIKQARRFDLR